MAPDCVYTSNHQQDDSLVKPQRDTFKCNCGGLSKANSRPSAIGFCIRDREGNLMYAEAMKLTEDTSLIAKAGAIKNMYGVLLQ